MISGEAIDIDDFTCGVVDHLMVQVVGGPPLLRSELLNRSSSAFPAICDKDSLLLQVEHVQARQELLGSFTAPLQQH